jgi:hypothetical protein
VKQHHQHLTGGLGGGQSDIGSWTTQRHQIPSDTGDARELGLSIDCLLVTTAVLLCGAYGSQRPFMWASSSAHMQHQVLCAWAQGHGYR